MPAQPQLLDQLPPDRLYLDGRWTAPRTSTPIDVEDPATGELLGRVAAAGPEDVHEAVLAAERAFPAWAALEPGERADHLDALRSAMADRAADLAELVTAELGTPIRFSRAVQVGLPLRVLESTSALLRDPGFAAPERLGHSLVLRDPVGVVGGITPWNYPLHQAVAKIAGAFAAGCPVVLKPSGLTPLSALALADLADRAGLPPGVLNVVPGGGRVVGEALVRHPGVAVVSFTGSTTAGARVAALAGERLARVALELGGKSASVVLPGADLARAVRRTVDSCLLNAGQTCTAQTRLLVRHDRYAEAVDLAVAASQRYRPGDPTDPETRLGPLVSADHRRTVTGHIARAVHDGARLAVDGRDAAGPDGRGHYCGPTVVVDADPAAAIAQQEVFGPVLTVLPYRDEEEAVRIANGTPYGLAGAVWAEDDDTATAVARRLRTGQVDINGAPFNPVAPFGGYGHSGYGRELGPHGIAEFQQLKAVQLPL
ncbi:aldehyde dehydrogenase family protein [Actinoalloteichus sp. AHMU CJ021]|uniref:aldehyde dehydrogenase family protein n=1 Tax=Actinoalloteichus sp. AHMU CJ021 TaxID=2072503 RepID=UPI0026C3B589